MLAIEINSAGHATLLPGMAADAVSVVPAVAVLEPPAVLTGQAAARRARLAPLFVSRAHWERPDATRLPRTLPGCTTHGEVAWQQLSALWPDPSMPGVLAVSPAATPADIGHLAGLFTAAARPLLALVDAAVTATAQRPASARALYLEVEAGRAVLAELWREQAAAGWQARRGRVDLAPTAGATAMDEAVARAVAAHFLRNVRFDPLTLAVSEQALYDALPAVYSSVAAGLPATVVIGEGANRRESTVGLDELAQACTALVQQLFGLVQSARQPGETLTVHVGARAAQLPGLLAALSALPDLSVDALPWAAAVVGAQVAGHGLSTANADDAATGVRWLTALPCVEPLTLVTASVPSAEVPTHVVWQGRAWPLGTAPLVLGRAPGPGGLLLEGPLAGMSRLHCQLRREDREAVVEDLSTYGTWLNGERIRRRARLRAGDRLRLGLPGVELLLIAVETAPPPAAD